MSLNLVVFVMVGVVLVGCDSISGEEPSVLVATLDSIHRLWPPAPPDSMNNTYTLGYRVLGGYVNTIDFNYENRSFCYIHPRQYPVLYRWSNFTCVSVDDFTKSWQLPNPTLFKSQATVTVMAYDWASKAWYFADSWQRCLYVCDSSLQHCRILHRDVEDPRGLAVDPTPPEDEGKAAGFLFWSQTNPTPSRLARSDLSGSAVTPLLPKDCSEICNPKALTLDIARKLVFWVDGEADTVEQSNYDGSNRITVFKISEAYNRDIRVFSMFMSTLYLPGYRSIQVTPQNSTETFTSVNGFPTTAAVYHGSRQPKVSHPCAVDNGGCQHICVTTYQGITPVATCLCQHGYRLEKAKHGVCTRILLDTYMLVSREVPPMVEVRASPLSTTMVAAPVVAHKSPVADLDTQTEYIYLFDFAWSQIIRQKLDGTGREIFIKDGIGIGQGLAVDWMGGNLYWTDEHAGRVSVARLSAPAQRRELIIAKLLHPHSIVLDPERGAGSIETANMDGSARRILVSEDLERPNGLVLDKEKQILYWCDVKLNKIEKLELASNERSTVLAAPQASIQDPFGLMFFEGDLIWSEEKTGKLRRLGPAGKVTDLDEMTPPLCDIKIVSKAERGGRNACSSDNGGCSELCLATPVGRTCGCASGRTPDMDDPTRCVESTPQNQTKQDL